MVGLLILHSKKSFQHLLGIRSLKELETSYWIEESEKQSEIEKQHELQNLLWEQELEELLVDKSFPLDPLHDHLGKANLWSNQLRQNPLENEKNKKLDENKELEEKSFQSVIFKKKLVALLPEKHFASAASSQLLGNEAWEKYREASEEIRFDNVRGKELSQELRRAQLDCKELRSASLRALCPSNFEDNSLQQATFKEESFTASTFPEKSFDKSSFADSSFTEETFAKNSFTESSLTKNSFAERLEKEELRQDQLLREHLLREQLLREQLGGQDLQPSNC